MKIYRKTFEDNSYVEDTDINLLPEGGELSEIDITDRIKNEADACVSDLIIKTQEEISKLIGIHIERKIMRGIEIPQEINTEYLNMISDYHVKKSEIYNEFNINP